MRQLSLLRHAKAAKGDPTVGDVDRPLDDAGRAEAGRIGAYFERRGLAPDGVVCSPSLRTRQTLEAVTPCLAATPRIIFSDRLYHAPPDEILADVQDWDDALARLLLVGHNPGFHLLALDLIDTSRSDGDVVNRIAEAFPTAALAVIEFDVPRWRDVRSGKGVLRHFETP